jgi:hypothetical protein
MPVPSRRLKDLIEGTVDHHASQRWPALEEVTIRWRGSYGYLTGYLSEDDDETIPLCRIQYLGDPDEWAFAIWQASTDSYAEAVLLDGRPTGHPTTALDTACTLYLAGTSDHPAQPDKPLRDLRGAALVTSARPQTGARPGAKCYASGMAEAPRRGYGEDAVCFDHDGQCCDRRHHRAARAGGVASARSASARTGSGGARRSAARPRPRTRIISRGLSMPNSMREYGRRTATHRRRRLPTGSPTPCPAGRPRPSRPTTMR